MRLTYCHVAIPFGAPGAEKVNLNVDSLWSGGPFEVEVRKFPIPPCRDSELELC